MAKPQAIGRGVVPVITLSLLTNTPRSPIPVLESSISLPFYEFIIY